MPPDSMGELGQQALRLISRAFGSVGSMIEFLFVTFIKVSPMDDRVDFFLICLFIAGVITLIYRLFRGKQ
jgi:hypothetical protein